MHIKPKTLEMSTSKKSPICREYYELTDDIHVVTCSTCQEKVKRGSGDVRKLNTTNMISHIQKKHRDLYQEFLNKKANLSQTDGVKPVYSLRNILSFSKQLLKKNSTRWNRITE